MLVCVPSYVSIDTLYLFTFTARISNVHIKMNRQNGLKSRSQCTWHQRSRGMRKYSGFNDKAIILFAEINAHPEVSIHQKLIFQRGEYTKPMGFDGWFFEGGSTQNWWALMSSGVLFLLLKIKRPGRLFWQIRYLLFPRSILPLAISWLWIMRWIKSIGCPVYLADFEWPRGSSRARIFHSRNDKKSSLSIYV